jgi:hypothetical protein
MYGGTYSGSGDVGGGDIADLRLFLRGDFY